MAHRYPALLIVGYGIVMFVTSVTCFVPLSIFGVRRVPSPSESRMVSQNAKKRNSNSDELPGLEPPPPNPEQLARAARRSYLEVFGSPDPSKTFTSWAPGRVNLIGEHTDYSQGFVFPLALTRGTVVFGEGRLVPSSHPNAGQIQVGSIRRGGQLVTFVADENLSPGEPHWSNYVRGVLAQYIKDVPEGMAFEMNLMISSSVPIGGGVSSSAALTVSVATYVEAVLKTAGVPISSDPRVKARKCQKCEHDFLDLQCGIMDQFVSAMAEPGHALLIDCRSETATPVELSDPDVVIVVTNSNIKHSLAQRGSQYPVRVQQCATAVKALKEVNPDIKTLRDANMEQLDLVKDSMDEICYRRARHVIKENDRCEMCAEALKRRDYRAVGEAMKMSHESLRKDYEVSCPELDILVRLANETPGVYGSRLTGAGFGGCTVTLAKKSAVEDLVQHLQINYKAETGVNCTCFVTSSGGGAKMLAQPKESENRIEQGEYNKENSSASAAKKSKASTGSRQ